MSLKYSRFGRRRMMSKRAEAFILDHSQLFFLGRNLWKNFLKPSEFKFIMMYFVDPDDGHKYSLNFEKLGRYFYLP
jgi:hypothetical protein